MTKKQLEHYLKGGKFTAIYAPVKTDDLSGDNLDVIGRSITVHQNMLITPIMKGEYGQDWEGQFRFNSVYIDGWFPEEDVVSLNIIHEYIEHREELPVHWYRMEYTDRKSIRANFGKGYEDRQRVVITRQYWEECHEYVTGKLHQPGHMPDYIDYCCWEGQLPVEWTRIFVNDKTLTQ